MTYEPCQACFIRFGKSYTKVCDDTCSYAKAVKDLKDTQKALEKAYAAIGQLVEKHNCFQED